jgi:hypothetical protein
MLCILILFVTVQHSLTQGRPFVKDCRERMDINNRTGLTFCTFADCCSVFILTQRHFVATYFSYLATQPLANKPPFFLLSLLCHSSNLLLSLSNLEVQYMATHLSTDPSSTFSATHSTFCLAIHPSNLVRHLSNLATHIITRPPCFSPSHSPPSPLPIQNLLEINSYL